MKNKHISLITILITIILTLFVILSSTACSSSLSEPKTITVEASYAFDISNYRNLAVFYKYIFIGRIDSTLRQEYDDSGLPCTVYNVVPIFNIQGELEKGRTVLYKKEGGLSKDGKNYYLLSGDIIPEENKLYIFCTRAIEDGEVLFSSGANSTIALEENITPKNLLESDRVNDMIAACENPAYLNDDHLSVNTTRSVFDAKVNPTCSIDDLQDETALSKALNQLSNTGNVQINDKILTNLTGNYNYFFVGVVDDDGELFISESGIPRIEYTVTPVYSIVDGTMSNYRDQKFLDDQSIPFFKYGGISVYGDEIELTRQDVFPEKGKLYIFSCTSTIDGKALYSYSPYSVMPLENGIDITSIGNSNLVKALITARNNPAEVSHPVMYEFGYPQCSNFTLQHHIDELYHQEIALAEKEGREPFFDYNDEIYKYPEWLERDTTSKN